MTTESKPFQTLSPEELESCLRDSHVEIKGSPEGDGGPAPVGGVVETSAPAGPATGEGGAPRLHLVSSASPEPERLAAVETGEHRGRDHHLIDAERRSGGDDTEARFHRRRIIVQAVRAVRDSRSPSVGNEPSGGSTPSLLRTSLWIAGAAAVAASIAFGLSMALRAPGPGAQPAGADLNAPPVPVEAVRLELRGVPEGATVRLDGATVRGSTVSVTADGEAHTLSVDAAGYRRWSVTLAPSADRAVPVELAAEPPEGGAR